MDEFSRLCVELLERAELGPVRTRAMFGAQGVYVDGLFLAIVNRGELFLKVDDTSRPRFEAAGCTPFTYQTRDGASMTMSYYRVPEEALESPPLMQPWARLAFEAALRAANAKPARPRSATPRRAAAKKAPARR
ncbi:MAG: competence protein TfoX [Roseateles depolymerans]|uniref:Competence protein TfoX n=1 Tax=Roseateles depolymerans TaxID=76731 RepID=A0A2W5DKK8_9BURK|nr:MAG: competence protein TfoX [Roseateles depolymerans]PZR25641.1 MAG: competence protein TfoX [Azospira oryzae]